MRKKVVELRFKIAHTGDDLGTQLGGIFSQQMFRELLLPRMKRHWKVFTDSGIPIMFHSCGNITRYIPDLLEIGLSILEPCQPAMDLKYLEREYGQDVVFMGGQPQDQQTFSSISVKKKQGKRLGAQ